jgi:hypothetical protein
MRTKTETFRDKAAFGPGPWQEEPDKIQWLDDATGLPCLVVRNDWGTLCGYVGVGPGHPLYEVKEGQDTPALKEAWARRKETPIGTLAESPVALVLAASMTDDENPAPDAVFEVHGGLTYSGHCRGHICHEVEPGEEDSVWWFGFDCGHYKDLQPRMAADYPDAPMFDCVYRDVSYVQAECRKLARQLAEVTP